VPGENVVKPVVMDIKGERVQIQDHQMEEPNVLEVRLLDVPYVPARIGILRLYVMMES